jgi:hypothetical protein
MLDGDLDPWAEEEAQRARLQIDESRPRLDGNLDPWAAEERVRGTQSAPPAPQGRPKLDGDLDPWAAEEELRKTHSPIPDNPYTDARPDGVMRDFEPEVVRARPKEQRSIYDSPEIRSALEKVGMAPRTFGGSAPNGQIPENPYLDSMPVQTQQARTASLGSQDEAQRVAMRAPGSQPLVDPRRAAPPLQPPEAPLTPQQEALRRVAPPPVQLPQGTQQALQATGSQYQLPQVQGLNPRAGIRDLQGSIVGSANDRASLSQRHAAIQSDVDAGQSAVANDAADVSQARNAAVDQRGQQMLQRTDANRQDAYDHVEQMRQAVADKPGEQRPGLRIAGQILSFIPGLNGIGRGMYRMAKGKDAEAQAEWASKIEGHKTVATADNAMNDQEHGDFKNEQVENHMARLERDAVALNRAEAIAKAGSSEQARLKGANDALNIRDQMANTLLGWRAQEAKKAGAGARNAEDTNILRTLASVPDADRPALAMKMGPRAVELQKGAQANSTAVVDMGKKLADTESTLAEAEAKRNEVKTGGKLTDGDKKLQRLAEGVRPAYNTLSKYADKVGKGEASVPYIGIGPNATTMFADEDTQGLNNNIQQLANVLLRDESGANLPPNEQETKWKSWGITSPDEAVRKQGLGKMLAEYEGRVSHVAPVTAPRGEAGGGTVMMKAPSGRLVPVPSSGVEKARAAGYTPTNTSVASSSGSF